MGGGGALLRGRGGSECVADAAGLLTPLLRAATVQVAPLQPSQGTSHCAHALSRGKTRAAEPARVVVWGAQAVRLRGPCVGGGHVAWSQTSIGRAHPPRTGRRAPGRRAGRSSRRCRRACQSRRPPHCYAPARRRRGTRAPPTRPTPARQPRTRTDRPPSSTRAFPLATARPAPAPSTQCPGAS
jgi:hypothetical protein